MRMNPEEDRRGDSPEGQGQGQEQQLATPEDVGSTDGVEEGGLPSDPAAEEPDVLEAAPATVLRRYASRRNMTYFTLGLAIVVVFLLAAALQGWVDQATALYVAGGLTVLMFSMPFLMRMFRRGPDFKAVDSLLEEECDPYRYARANYNLLVTFQNQHDRYVTMVDVANGLFLQGDIDGMESYLARVDLSAVTPMTLYWYYTLRLRCCLYLDDSEGFRHQQAEFSIARRSKKDRRLKESADAFRDVERFYWAYNRGDEGNARRALQDRTGLLSEQGFYTRFAQVECRYWQAMLEERIGDWAGMRESCEFVIENGNLLVYVTAAHEMLARHADEPAEDAAFCQPIAAEEAQVLPGDDAGTGE